MHLLNSLIYNKTANRRQLLCCNYLSFMGLLNVPPPLNCLLRFMTFNSTEIFEAITNMGQFILLSFLLVKKRSRPNSKRACAKNEAGKETPGGAQAHLCLLQTHSSGFLLFKCPLTSLKFLILSCKASIWGTGNSTITFAGFSVLTSFPLTLFLCPIITATHLRG